MRPASIFLIIQLSNSRGTDTSFDPSFHMPPEKLLFLFIIIHSGSRKNARNML